MKMSVRMWAHAQAGLEQAATVMATVAAAKRVALGLLWPHVRVYFRPHWLMIAKVALQERKSSLVKGCLYTDGLLAMLIANVNARTQACTSRY